MFASLGASRHRVDQAGIGAGPSPSPRATRRPPLGFQHLVRRRAMGSGHPARHLGRGATHRCSRASFSSSSADIPSPAVSPRAIRALASAIFRWISGSAMCFFRRSSSDIRALSFLSPLITDPFRRIPTHEDISGRQRTDRSFRILTRARCPSPSSFPRRGSDRVTGNIHGAIQATGNACSIARVSYPRVSVAATPRTSNNKCLTLSRNMQDHGFPRHPTGSAGTRLASRANEEGRNVLFAGRTHDRPVARHTERQAGRQELPLPDESRRPRVSAPGAAMTMHWYNVSVEARGKPLSDSAVLADFAEVLSTLGADGAAVGTGGLMGGPSATFSVQIDD